MANLVDTIKKNSQLLKRGSQLFEAAPDSLAGTVNKQGLMPGAAVSPGAAAGLGVSPDQAKMAGSAAQVQKAVRESIEPSKQAPGFAPTRTISTAEEKAKRAEAEQMQGLQGLGTRMSGLVNNYIQEAAKKASEEEALAKPTADMELIANDFPSLTEAQRAKIKNAIETGTIDAELWSLFPTAKDAATLQSALAKYSTAKPEAVTEVLKASFGPDVTLASLSADDFAELGITGLGDIANMLGMGTDEDALNKLRAMTIDQFQAAIQGMVSANFDRVQELSRVANDPGYPANVRASAQAELRELSSVGVVATEADVDRLNEAVQAADTIRVGNQDMTVAELLSDDGISSLVTAYFNDTDGSYKKLISEQFPELKAFIDANEAVLKNAATKLGDAAKASADIQQSNAKLEYSVDGNVKMTDFNKVAFGSEYDPTKPSNTDWSSKKTEAHKILDPETKEFSPEDKAYYAQFLNDMAKIAPEILKSDFLNLNAAGLRSKIPAGMSLREYVGQLTSYHTNLKNLDPASGLSNEAALAQALGGEANFQKMLDTYKELSLFRQMGFGDIPDNLKPVMAILDTAMADGKLDATELTGVRANLAQYLKSGYNIAANKSLYDLVNDAGNKLTTETYKVLWSKVKDGEITAEEAADLVATASTNEIARLYDKLSSTGLLVTGDVAGTLKGAMGVAEDRKFIDLIKAVPELASLHSMQTTEKIPPLGNKSIPELNRIITKLNSLKARAEPALHAKFDKVIATLNNTVAGLTEAAKVEKQREIEQKRKEKGPARYDTNEDTFF
jgi:hypothetical protein